MTIRNTNFSSPDSLDDEFQGQAAMKVETFLRWAGISRFLFYQQVKDGKIRPKKCGARTLITRSEAERWLRELPEAGSALKPEENAGE